MDKNDNNYDDIELLANLITWQTHIFGNQKIPTFDKRNSDKNDNNYDDTELLANLITWQAHIFGNQKNPSFDKKWHA